ncbi:MAG: penicillin-binding protein 2, partial [Pseudomonadota bacterium]|nr:penicillin-binding protein 2 [Pseudomonadota bacterium]
MNAFSGFGPAIAAGRSGHGAVSMALASGRVQLVNIRQESLTLARWRVLWIALGFAFVALLALVRIAYLGASDHGARGTSLEEALLPPRGEIADRNGVPLARAFPAYALWFNPTALGE